MIAIVHITEKAEDRRLGHLFEYTMKQRDYRQPFYNHHGSSDYDEVSGIQCTFSTAWD